MDSPTDLIHFEKWLSILGERAATDLHLTVGNVPVLRVAGEIAPLLDEDILTDERIGRIVAHLLSEEELARLSREREIIVSRTLKKIMRFRIHVFYSRSALAVSLRYLPSNEADLAQLGLPPVVGELAAAAQGLLLITGPFDSGKTTTVKAILSAINRTQKRYIVTIEQPIEYLIPSDQSVIVQREVGLDVKDFASALGDLAEEDANVVVVGRIDNAAVASAALHLANSGRLVIGVCESRYAISLLEEWRDWWPEADRVRRLTLLADTLLGVVAQLLLPRLGGGRMVVAEILRATNPVKSLLRDNKLRQIANVMQTARSEGMISLDAALAAAVKSGQVDLQTAKDHAADPNQFNILISH